MGEITVQDCVDMCEQGKTISINDGKVKVTPQENGATKGEN